MDEIGLVVQCTAHRRPWYHAPECVGAELFSALFVEVRGTARRGLRPWYHAPECVGAELFSSLFVEVRGTARRGLSGCHLLAPATWVSIDTQVLPSSEPKE